MCKKVVAKCLNACSEEGGETVRVVSNTHDFKMKTIFVSLLCRKSFVFFSFFLLIECANYKSGGDSIFSDVCFFKWKMILSNLPDFKGERSGKEEERDFCFCDKKMDSKNFEWDVSGTFFSRNWEKKDFAWKKLLNVFF